MSAVVDFVRMTPAWLLEHPGALGAAAAAFAAALVLGVAGGVRARRREHARNQVRFGRR